MLKAERERETIMRTKGKAKQGKLIIALICMLAVAITVIAKGNQPKVVGYIYDSGDTVWEMAEEHCPYGMDIRLFAREIEKANGIEDSTVYKNWSYKIPVYETEIKGDYLDMNTVVTFEATDDGVLLITEDGNGYFIEK